MSLVNDALRRASEIQKSVPPAATPDLKLRPIEPAQQRKSSASLLVAVLMFAILIGGLFLLWTANQKNKTASKQIPESMTATKPAAVAPVLISSPPPAPAVQPATTIAAAAPQTNNAASEMSAPAAVPAPPKPEPLKLQAVFFNPRNPSAIISGKTVFVGDSIRDFQVAAIGAKSATLIGASETNRLTME
jgi:hypothetical protein